MQSFLYIIKKNSEWKPFMTNIVCKKLGVLSSWNKKKCYWKSCLSPSDRPRQQIKLHPISWQYPLIDYVVPDQNKFDQYNCYQYNCSICDETLKSKNDFEEHTNVCQCASITDCCCSCHKEKNKRKKVKSYTIQTYKPHRFFKPQKDLDEHNNTHQNQEID